MTCGMIRAKELWRKYKTHTHFKLGQKYIVVQYIPQIYTWFAIYMFRFSSGITSLSLRQSYNVVRVPENKPWWLWIASSHGSPENARYGHNKTMSNKTMSISYWMHHQTSNKRGTKPQKLNVLSRLAVVVAQSSQVLSREWRCSWSSADRRCSNYIWVISNCIAYLGVAYIRGLMALYLVSAVWCSVPPGVW